MNLTTKQIKQLIKEEINKLFENYDSNMFSDLKHLARGWESMVSKEPETWTKFRSDTIEDIEKGGAEYVLFAISEYPQLIANLLLVDFENKKDFIKAIYDNIEMLDENLNKALKPFFIQAEYYMIQATSDALKRSMMEDIDIEEAIYRDGPFASDYVATRRDYYKLSKDNNSVSEVIAKTKNFIDKHASNKNNPDLYSVSPKFNEEMSINILQKSGEQSWVDMHIEYYTRSLMEGYILNWMDGTMVKSDRNFSIPFSM